MQSYHSLYIHLFRALSTATQALEEGDIATAQRLLIAAQQEAEEAVLVQDILPEEKLTV